MEYLIKIMFSDYNKTHIKESVGTSFLIYGKYSTIQGGAECMREQSSAICIQLALVMDMFCRGNVEHQFSGQVG